ncbi:MAG: hypothetical protein ABJA78_00795 [Ferruginibacter sp.]
MQDYTNVLVTKNDIPLLENGTGTSNDGALKTFSCGKFALKTRPVKKEKYQIAGTRKSDNKRIFIVGECTFEGETSQFKNTVSK